MSETPVTEAPEAGAAEAKPSGRPPLGRSLIEAIITGNSAVVTFLAIFVALVCGGILIGFSDQDVLSKFSYFFAAPGDALSALWSSVWTAYKAMFEGSIIDPGSVSSAAQGGSIAQVFTPISNTLVRATPLMFTGLAVSLAFRAGMFNIGAQGQLLIGALLSGYIGFKFGLPPVIAVVVCVAAGFVGGAVCGFIPGWLKAKTGAHEVITTIMLNYIAYNLLFWLLTTKSMQRPGRTDPISPLVRGNARLPHLFGGGLLVEAGLLVALAAAVGVAWLLHRSTIGFEFRASGFNPDAARTAGMSISKTFVLAMVLSGGLAGLGGADQVLGQQFTLTPGISGNLGFDAITVALLGRTSPGGTVLAALLFGALESGGVTMQAATQTPVDVVTVIQSLIVMFIAAPPLVRWIFRLRGARTGGEGQTLAKGW